MELNIETEQEVDGRWIAEVMDLPGVMGYGKTREDAIARVEALAQQAAFSQVCYRPVIPRHRRGRSRWGERVSTG